MDISDLLQGPMKNIIIGQLSNQLGLGNDQKTSAAVDGVFGTLLNGILNNASTPEGQQSLENALEKDHNGSILDDLSGFLTGTNKPENESTTNGAGILKHILGDKKDDVVNSISNASGIDTSKILQMMMTLAPILLGFLGKAKSQTNQQSGGGLLDIIKGATQTVQKSPAQSILESVLGQKNSGGIMGEITNAATKSILGKLFGK